MKQVYGHNAMCRQVARHLQEELDTRLHSRACREIKKHLERCPNCTAYLDSLKKTIFLYGRFPDAHVPSRTREKLFAILKLRG